MIKKKQEIIFLKDYELPLKKALKMTDEALVARRDELKAMIKEAEQILADSIDPVLYERAEKYPNLKYGVENRTVLIIERPIYSTADIKFCRKKDALKEVPDGKVLKPLYDKGIKIPGLELSKFVTVQ